MQQITEITTITIKDMVALARDGQPVEFYADTDFETVYKIVGYDHKNGWITCTDPSAKGGFGWATRGFMVHPGASCFVAPKATSLKEVDAHATAVREARQARMRNLMKSLGARA